MWSSYLNFVISRAVREGGLFQKFVTDMDLYAKRVNKIRRPTSEYWARFVVNWNKAVEAGEAGLRVQQGQAMTPSHFVACVFVIITGYALAIIGFVVEKMMFTRGSTFFFPPQR